MLEGIPIGLTDLGSVGVLIIVFFMVMTGRLATPAHQKALNSRIEYLETVIKDQRGALTLALENARTVEQVGAVVEHTMSAISDRADTNDVV